MTLALTDVAWAFAAGDRVAPAGCGSLATAPTVHLVDPFLLGQPLSKIHLGPLYHVQNWTDVQANGLVADNTSAAIAVVQTFDCTNDVILTTTNGTTLLPYSPDFLTIAPAAGTQSLTIPAADLLLHNIGGVFFAAALVQAPVGAPAPSFTDQIVVTAQQGTQTATPQMMDMVPPPVVLVHGLWGDLTSLGGKDGAGGIDGLAHYLKTSPPWLTHPGLVKVLCYSKYFGFDAVADPLGGGSDPCEQTSKDALTSTIYGLFRHLKNKHIIGYRVDVVAHSMGGLAARNYASQNFYRPLRTRKQGQFHEVITLDTPELGSPLAHFLDKHSNCSAQDFSVTWDIFCKTVLSTTVAQCFAGQGDPLAAPGSDLTTGAVYSLYPHGPALQNPNLSGPNIAGANWDAVSANAPFNGALEADLNGLIPAIYPQNSPNCRAQGMAPLVFQILGDTNEDAVVTVPSQLAGAQANHFHTFQGLSHIKGVAIPGFGLSNDNVLDCKDVNQLVACWLSRSGDSACLTGVPDAPVCLTHASVAKTSPANKNASVPASVTQVSASKTASAPKNAVPMPTIVVAHPHSVNRLALSAPTGLELGTPFDLAVNTGSDDLPEIHVVQTDKNFSRTGSSREVPVAISHVDGHTVHLSVTPEFFGNTEFQVAAAYRDGGVAFKDFTTTVNLPSQPPTQFHADEFSDTGIRIVLDDNSSVRLHPWAIYANVPGHVYLDTRYVSYSIAPAAGPPAVSLAPNGVIHGLRPGTATIIGRLGSFTDQVRVEVEAEQQ
ncbi:MAG: hypothetical protein DLM68_18355 [Hyphomicrobiales bacterium]|nr:MAG: hypothetical protein DLM68_18355 [Hyphomicrobiales bacterium]